MKFSHDTSEAYRSAIRGANPTEIDFLFEALGDEACGLSEALLRYSSEHMPKGEGVVASGVSLVAHFRERYPDTIEAAHHSLAVLVFIAAKELPLFDAVRILVNKPGPIDDTPRNRAIADAIAIFFKSLKA